MNYSLNDFDAINNAFFESYVVQSLKSELTPDQQFVWELDIAGIPVNSEEAHIIALDFRIFYNKEEVLCDDTV